MNSCTCENWTLEDVSNALQNLSKDNKVIVVPMFQRGKRWNKSQESTFIDSMRKGYPVGTMLFYKKIEDGRETYILVDGLQRGNTIRKYMNMPTEFFTTQEISESACINILRAMDISENDISKVKNALLSFVQEQKKLKFTSSQYLKLSRKLCEMFEVRIDIYLEQVVEKLEEFFSHGQADFEKIGKSVIPVIVYNGDESNLPEIFDRINSKGTPLNLYEVYAASWPVDKKFRVECEEIIDAVIRKYEILSSDGYILHNYSKEKLHESKELNAFEFLFGLSKYITKKYPNLAFGTNLDDDSVNPLAFELVNACLNDGDKIKSLYEHILNMDVNVFVKALEHAIEFVDASVAVVTRFKGNSRKSNKLFHSKFQILSMISTTFKEMYPFGNYSAEDESFKDKKHILQANLLRYYVYDILTDYWSEGGTGKIHTAAKPNRYMQGIADISWMVAIDSYFEKSMQRVESKKVKTPSSEEYVIMNCVYLNTFTAMDQLSVDNFDVEHIAPKAQMQSLISTTKLEGLPISSVANLCYLPDSANRSKGSKNFYQDSKYLQHINLDDVENKYSFTTSEDLEWMDYPYDPQDADTLKEFYVEFLRKRYHIIKKLFCESLGINIVETPDVDKEDFLVSESATQEGKINSRKMSSVCMRKLSEITSEQIVHLKNKYYKTIDNKKGYVAFFSKQYKQGDKEKYWYGLRSYDTIEGCDEVFYVFGCKSDETILVIPKTEIFSKRDNLNNSEDENGDISHWHIVFFKYPDGRMTWFLSKPEKKEVSIDKYIVSKNK